VCNAFFSKPADLAGILQRVGLVETRQRGSHRLFRDSAARTTVPFHPGREIAPALFRRIANDVGLTIG
jgi:predicted RNA binding protein YcfA (HicA-like mRNA interferase family)